MKQLLILVMTFLGIVFGISAQNRSINFIEGKTFEEIKEIAKKENKMIFIDFYTTWCGPCKKMDKEVYTNDGVADFYNTNFINIKMDAEKGEGKELAKKYKVRLLPGLLFFTNDGEISLAEFGFQKKIDFIQIGSNAMNSELNFLKQQSELNDSVSSDDPILAIIVFYSGRNFEPIPESKRTLKSILKTLKEKPDIRINIEGFSNDPEHIFMDEYLRYMAMLRAISVRNFLVSKGIEVKRIQVDGYVSRNVLTSNPKDIFKGDRVEIKLVLKE